MVFFFGDWGSVKEISTKSNGSFFFLGGVPFEAACFVFATRLDSCWKTRLWLTCDNPYKKTWVFSSLVSWIQVYRSETALNITYVQDSVFLVLLSWVFSYLLQLPMHGIFWVPTGYWRLPQIHSCFSGSFGLTTIGLKKPRGVLVLFQLKQMFDVVSLVGLDLGRFCLVLCSWFALACSVRFIRLVSFGLAFWCASKPSFSIPFVSLPIAGF